MNIPMYSIHNMPKPTAISLFSGMGGDSLGMERAGFHVIAFNEFDKSGIESHQANFPDSVLIQDSSQKKDKDNCKDIGTNVTNMTNLFQNSYIDLVQGFFQMNLKK